MSKEFSSTTVRLCIDRDEDEAFSGRVVGICLEKAIPFHSKQELLMLVDQAYDYIGQPQPMMVLRSFQEGQKEYNSYVGSPMKYHSSDEISGIRGEVSTYDISMFSRKYAEWQGVIRDVDGNTVGSFNTSLECMNLL